MQDGCSIASTAVLGCDLGRAQGSAVLGAHVSVKQHPAPSCVVSAHVT